VDPQPGRRLGRNKKPVFAPQPLDNQKPVLNFEVKADFHNIQIESQTHREMGTESHGSFSWRKIAGLPGKGQSGFLLHLNKMNKGGSKQKDLGKSS
jgi:hypothetical protein